MKKWVAIHQSQGGKKIFLGAYCCICNGGFKSIYHLFDRLNIYSESIVFDLFDLSSGAKTFIVEECRFTNGEHLLIECTPLLLNTHDCLCMCDKKDIVKANFFRKMTNLHELSNLCVLRLVQIVNVELILPNTLKKLCVQNCLFHGKIKGNCSLIEISISNSDIEFETSQTKHVKKLEIACCPNLVWNIEDMLEIEYLTLDYCPKIKFMLDPTRLEGLTISSSDVYCGRIAKFLRNNHIIRKLDIGRLCLESGGICEVLETCINLEELTCGIILTRHNFLNRLKKLTIHDPHGIMKCPALLTRLEELYCTPSVIEHTFSPGLRVCHTSRLDNNDVSMMPNIRELNCGGEITLPLERLVKTNNPSLYDQVDHNLTKRYKRRLIMTYLLFFRPRDVTCSIAKEIKSWE
jgi:hypothetical protein